MYWVMTNIGLPKPWGYLGLYLYSGQAPLIIWCSIVLVLFYTLIGLILVMLGVDAKKDVMLWICNYHDRKCKTKAETFLFFAAFI